MVQKAFSVTANVLCMFWEQKFLGLQKKNHEKKDFLEISLKKAWFCKMLVFRTRRQDEDKLNNGPSSSRHSVSNLET